MAKNHEILIFRRFYWNMLKNLTKQNLYFIFHLNFIYNFSEYLFIEISFICNNEPKLEK